MILSAVFNPSKRTSTQIPSAFLRGSSIFCEIHVSEIARIGIKEQNSGRSVRPASR